MPHGTIQLMLLENLWIFYACRTVNLDDEHIIHENITSQHEEVADPITEVKIASEMDEQSIPALLSLPAYLDINHTQPPRRLMVNGFSFDANWQNLSRQGGFHSLDMRGGSKTSKRYRSPTQFRCGPLSLSGSICQMINDIPAIYSYIPLRWFYTILSDEPSGSAWGGIGKNKACRMEQFHNLQGLFSIQVDWYPLASWIIWFFSSTSPTLIRHSAQKARKESNWSLSKVKSVCPLSFSPFVPFARLSDFHKIVKWIYEPKNERNSKAGKAQRGE